MGVRRGQLKEDQVQLLRASRMLGLLRCEVSPLDVVRLETILNEHAPFVEESQGYNSLGNPNSLSSKDSTKAEFGRICDHFLAGFNNAN